MGALLIHGSLVVVRGRETRVVGVRWEQLGSIRRIGSNVVAVGRSSDRRRRPAIAMLAVGSIRLLPWRGNHVRLLHRCTSESRCCVGLSHTRLRIHSLDRYDISQAGVVCRLLEFRLTVLWSRIV